MCFAVPLHLHLRPLACWLCAAAFLPSKRPNLRPALKLLCITGAAMSTGRLCALPLSSQEPEGRR